MANPVIKELRLKDIRVDGNTQSRVEMNELVVKDYGDALTEGATMPPAIVYFDGTDHWLADGFHRFLAYGLIDARTMPCEIRKGDQRDAKLHSFGANQDHGLRRSNADKHKAVEGMLSDPTWAEWSDRAIAKHVGVSHTFVAQLRGAFVTGNVASEKPAERTYKTKHGTTATMDVSGQQQAAKERAEQRQADPSPSNLDGEPTVATPREQPTSGPVAAFRPAVAEQQITPEESPANTAGAATGAAADDGAAAPEGGDDEQPDGGAADLGTPSMSELIQELQDENNMLTGLVRAVEADDQKAETLKWRKAYDAAVLRQSEAMENAARSQKREKWSMSQLRRCGKAVGEDDPERIAAAVEAAVRRAAEAAA